MVSQTHSLNERHFFENVAATQGPFTLKGGLYAVTVSANWGGGSVTLQILGPDDTTYITCLTAFSADGYATVHLPPGTYQFLRATATAVYIDITAIARGV